MKRFLTILLAAVAVSAALCVGASASSFDGAAAELSAIGMFKGTAAGFDLDSAPTRGQAAIMLVRLHGMETQAQNTYRSGRTTCPFTDVSETVAPYVAWLLDEGLTTGITETTFGASEPCTAKAYTIFLLRALGYEDNVDFTTANAEEFAMSLGLLDTSMFTGKFLRDDLAAMTYQALGMDMKDGDTYLLDYLIKEEGISVAAARPMVTKIEACRALDSASQDMNKGLSVDLEANINATLSNTAAGDTQPSGLVENAIVSVKGEIKAVMGRNPQMALDLTATTNGENENVKIWMRDGWVYTQTAEMSVKTDLGDVYETLLADTNQASSVAMLPFLESIKQADSGKKTVYTLELNGALEDMINSMVSQVLKEAGLPEGMIGKLDLGGLTMVYNVDNGTLKSVVCDGALSINMLGSEGATTTLGMVIDMKIGVKAAGSAVKISFPDFSGFEEVIGGEEASAVGVIGGADGPTAIITATV